MQELSTVAVIRDTQDGTCFLVPADNHEAIDAERLEGEGYEIAGWLQHAEQYNEAAKFADDENEGDPDKNGLPVYAGPYFTVCEHEGCGRMIAISEEGGAPELCTEHEEHEPSGLWSVRNQPLNDEDTDVEIVDELSKLDALHLAYNRALARNRAQDVYQGDVFTATVTAE